jgi:hypothetical protein
MSDSTITGGGIPLPAASYVTTDGVSLLGAGTAENPITSATQQTYNPQVNTIYVRPTGNDGSGTGSLAEPFLTLVAAVLAVPPTIPAGQRWVIDVTGTNEVLPANFTLPAWKAPWTTDIVSVGADALFTAAVAIQATPQASPLSPSTDAIVNSGDVEGQVAAAVSGLITLTLNTPRASWGNNALRGQLAIAGAVGGGQNCVIYASTTTTISLCISAAITEFPLTISVPGATFTGSTTNQPDAGGAAHGALRAINVDSLLVSGLTINNSVSLTSPGLAFGGSGAYVAQLCNLQSPELAAASTALTRAVRCWITGAPLLRSNGGAVTVMSSLADTWTGVPVVGNGNVQFRTVVFSACATIQAATGDPAGPSGLEGNVPMTWLFQNCIITATPGASGDGFLFTGGKAELISVDVNSCGRDGIRCAAGAGWMHLAGVGSVLGVVLPSGTTTANTEYGINVQDGLRVGANAATSANAHLLAGTTAAILVGALAAVSWATWVDDANNSFDITAVGATGATGSGSQLYGTSF